LFIIAIFAANSIYRAKKKKTIISFYKKMVIFGFGISAFFTIPAVFELSDTVFFKTKVSSYGNYFADYNLVGVTTFIIMVLSLLLFIINRSLYKKHRLTVVIFIVSVVSVFFATFPSEILWRFLPVSFIQFPFRMLSVTILCVAFLLAFVLSQFSLRYKVGVGIAIIFATVVLSGRFLIPDFSNLPDSFYSTNEATTTVADEYMPIWVTQKPDSHFKNKVKVVAGEGSISNVLYDSRKISFNFDSETPSIVRINTIYYPGWRAESSGTQKAIFYDNPTGVIDLKLEAGKQNVKLVFGETPLRVLADLVSIVSFISLFLLVYKKKIIKLIK
jgi:hypothetical protein